MSRDDKRSVSQQKGSQSGLVAIIGKEFRRFFTDRRIVLTTILLPGLMIYAIYSVMGSAMQNMFAGDSDYQPQVYAVNLPQSLTEPIKAFGITFDAVSSSEIEAIKARITEQEADLLVVFPTGFEEQIGRELAGEQGVLPPEIEMYYNSARSQSVMQYQLIYALLDSYKNALSPVFAINSGSTQYDLASQQDTAGLMFSMMLPMLITVFLFSGCMAVAPESIAGEKERGTIATMLVTPLARWELALGKIVALACIALLSGLSSFIGVMLSIPKLFQTLPEESVAILYGFSDYAMLLGVILSTVMIYIGLISILSALAKTIKEANTYVMPLMIVILMVGALGMFSQGASKEALTYLIPVYNSVQCMVGIFSFAINPLFIFVTIATNSLVTATCVIILTKMFNSERIVFNR